MNQVPEEKKDSVTKTLAILGFVAIIILIVWLAVKVVALIPSAFSSLASIADSVYGDRNSELEVSTPNSVVNSGEAFDLSWEPLRGDGTYGFQYKCVDSITLDIRTENGGTQTIPCDTYINLSDATEVTVLINTETQRFTDITYTVAYAREGAENITTDSVVTVVNTAIPTGVTVAPEVKPEVTPVTPTTPTPTAPTTPASPAQPVPKPQVVQHYIYQIPVSDPNGKIDLQVVHKGVGVMKNGVFTLQPKLERGETGAIQFEIKNIGTKTSGDWSYEAELPSDITYKSDDQKALKPNERVVITLEFDGITRIGTESFGVEVTAEKDVNKINNEYTWAVEVVR